VVRYTYWISQVIAIGGEAVAAGLYMTFWFPDVPVWMWSLGFCVILLYFQLPLGQQLRHGGILVRDHQGDRDRVVHHPGRGEHFRARPAGTELSQPDGPAGRIPAEWLRRTVDGGHCRIFSFNGIEGYCVTSGEAQNPQVAIPAALRTMVFRLFAF